MVLSVTLLVLRLAVGLLLFGHGSQKMLGWFGGHGYAATVGFLKSQGFKPAWFWTLLGGLGELVGGVLLVLGFLSPLGAIAVFAAMLMAVIKFHWSKGLWSTNGGYEYPLVLAVISVALGLLGSGAYSLDALFGVALPNVPLFLIGVLAAIVVDVIGLVASRRETRENKQQVVA